MDITALKQKIKKIVYSQWGIAICNRLNLKNRYHFGKSNAFFNQGAWLRGVTIKIRGYDNRIILGENSSLHSCTIQIYGNGNTIEIGSDCHIQNGAFWIEDNGGKITIGDKTTIQGNTHLAVIEGTKIEIGQDCMFSSNIVFRTGDSHSIVNAERMRINPSGDIQIGNHVWVGEGVVCLKNVCVADHSIVGTRSLLTKRYETPHVILAGSPAKIVKENTDWLRERISFSG